jgi:hypothetical protein
LPATLCGGKDSGVTDEEDETEEAKDETKEEVTEAEED